MTLLRKVTGLFRPAWKHPDPGRRKQAATKLIDITNLAYLVAHDADAEVQAAANQRLADIVGTETNRKRRTDAIFAISDSSLLADIATTHSEPPARRLAVTCLRDQELIKAIATDDGETKNVRRAAVGILTDQETLRHIAIWDKSISIKGKAIERLDDEATLIHIAQDESEIGLRRKAIQRLNNSQALESLALSDPNAEIRLLAVERINNQEVLAEVCLKDDCKEVVQTARARIGDEVLGASVDTRMAKQRRARADAARRKREGRERKREAVRLEEERRALAVLRRSSSTRNCAACGNPVRKGRLQCPKCGSGNIGTVRTESSYARNVRYSGQEAAKAQQGSRSVPRSAESPTKMEEYFVSGAQMRNLGADIVEIEKVDDGYDVKTNLSDALSSELTGHHERLAEHVGLAMKVQRTRICTCGKQGFHVSHGALRRDGTVTIEYRCTFCGRTETGKSTPKLG